jgi:hypothetical protein
VIYEYHPPHYHPLSNFQGAFGVNLLHHCQVIMECEKKDKAFRLALSDFFPCGSLVQGDLKKNPNLLN